MEVHNAGGGARPQQGVVGRVNRAEVDGTLTHLSAVGDGERLGIIPACGIQVDVACGAAGPERRVEADRVGRVDGSHLLIAVDSSRGRFKNPLGVKIDEPGGAAIPKQCMALVARGSPVTTTHLPAAGNSADTTLREA